MEWHSHRFTKRTARGAVRILEFGFVTRSLSVLVPLLLLTATASFAQDLPPQLADRFSEGVAALKAGEVDAAETAFRDVLRRGGAKAFVHHNLGIALQQGGRHREALAEFHRALQLDSSFGPARLLAGTSLLALGRSGEAVTELKRAVRLMPNEPLAHLQLAEAYERTGDTAGLVDAYRRVVELSPRNEEYRYRLGKAYLRLAQSSYERLRGVDPNSARLSQALGREYDAQGQLDMAVPAFEKAARLNPDLPEVHLALARIHLDQGRLNEAAGEIERELAIAPDSKEARELKSVIDAAMKR
jgi:protein O-GlcNAc transferase